VSRTAQHFIIRPEDRQRGWPVAGNCSAAIRESIKTLHADGKAVEVVIDEYKKNRSGAQNRCFHGWMRAIAQWHREATGSLMDQKAWKLWFKRSLIGYEVVDLPDGQQETHLRSTKDLSVAEFAEVLTQIDAWGADQDGLVLPRNQDYAIAMGIEKAAADIPLVASRSGASA